MPGRKPRSYDDVRSNLINQLKTMFKVDSDGCWIWVGAYYGNGYPRLSRHRPIAGLHQRAHIASYQYYKGPVSDGLFVCHKCDKKGCINPKHLWQGTNRDNQLDASVKGVFNKYWTKDRRAEKSRKMSGSGNPMYGVNGSNAPCYGRTGSKHPMFGKHHSTEAKQRISASLIKRKKKS